MGVSVAEYLGIRVDGVIPIVPFSPQHIGHIPPCPFRNHVCDKVKRGNKPVCSVRNESGHLWIVCQYRLCAPSPKDAPLNDHQIDVLRTVAKTIYSPQITDAEILVKREVSIRVTDNSQYSADFVMWRLNPQQTSPFNPDRAILLEMQGGGETTGTGQITSHINDWEIDPNRTNQSLAENTTAAPLPTNAWRRQQEQFLVKGNVAMLTGGKMVFCVGSILYDYLILRLTTVNLVDLRTANWTLALLTFDEDTSPNPSPRPACAPHSIPLKLDPTRCKFTNYASFVQALTNQASASPELFTGHYDCLAGGHHDINV